MATLPPIENESYEWKKYDGSEEFTGTVANLSDDSGAYLFVSAKDATPAGKIGVPLEPLGKVLVQIPSGEELYFIPMHSGNSVKIILG